LKIISNGIEASFYKAFLILNTCIYLTF